MVDVFAALEGVQEVEEEFLFLLQIMLSFLFNIFHMSHIDFDPLAFEFSEHLPEWKPVFLVEFPKVLWLPLFLDLNFGLLELF